jgi:hypothetical protein
MRRNHFKKKEKSQEKRCLRAISGLAFAMVSAQFQPVITQWRSQKKLFRWLLLSGWVTVLSRLNVFPCFFKRWLSIHSLTRSLAEGRISAMPTLAVTILNLYLALRIHFYVFN